jgi:hypothetical protein
MPDATFAVGLIQQPEEYGGYTSDTSGQAVSLRGVDQQQQLECAERRQ